MVVDKPTLLLAVPGRGPDKQDCVVARLAQSYPGIREVHRLDWETSGLMLLARHKEAHRALSRQFQEREVHKRYTALVYSRLSTASGSIELPLCCDWPNRPRQMVDHERGKPSQTLWRRLACDEQSSRVELTPVTGRSHQLRVHLQAIGHPILGDPLYAHASALGMAPRLMLHACELGFQHPSSGEAMHFSSPPPF